MIYGERDAVAPAEHLATFVPNFEETSLDSGHWIHQERSEETNRLILKWLVAQEASKS